MVVIRLRAPTSTSRTTRATGVRCGSGVTAAGRSWRSWACESEAGGLVVVVLVVPVVRARPPRRARGTPSSCAAPQPFEELPWSFVRCAVSASRTEVTGVTGENRGLRSRHAGVSHRARPPLEVTAHPGGDPARAPGVPVRMPRATSRGGRTRLLGRHRAAPRPSPLAGRRCVRARDGVGEPVAPLPGSRLPAARLCRGPPPRGRRAVVPRVAAAVERVDEAQPVDRLDDVGVLGNPAGLVRLELADEVDGERRRGCVSWATLSDASWCGSPRSPDAELDEQVDVASRGRTSSRR